MALRILSVLALLACVGCATDSSQRADSPDHVLDDPFADSNNERMDISGGGLMDFDKKAFKRDVNSVFNP